MTIKRTGRRYSDAESGITLGCWFPRDNQKVEQNCLVRKAELIRGYSVEIEIGYLSRTPTSIEETCRHLHLLSECATAPNELNLEGRDFPIRLRKCWFNWNTRDV